jgi:hypothetical protein
MLKIPKDLLDTLHDLRAKQLQWPYPPDFAQNNPVVILTLGLGPELYLGFDGRVFKRDFMDEDGPVYETKDLRDIAVGLVICSRDDNVPELVDLLPACPPDGVVCSACQGTRRIGLATGPWIVCGQCSGMGWAPATDPDRFQLS